MTRFEALRGRRVLLVDDNPVNRQLAGQLLDDVGVLWVAAEDGSQAIEALAQHEFDLVLMDCRMPVMDGFEATRAIRADARWRDLPIVAMTASVMVEEHQEARAAGMDDELVKPIDQTLLYSTLARWIDHRTRHRSSGAAAAPAVPSMDQLPGIDARLGLARAMDNRALYEKLLRLFLRMHSNFQPAFEQRLRDGDRVGLRRLAHDLKSSAGTLGAVAVQELAAVLERQCDVGASEAVLRESLARVMDELTPVLAGVRALPPAPST